jgi:hypothetical protein
MRHRTSRDSFPPPSARRGQGGQALLEFALSLPVLLLLLSICLDFGRAYLFDLSLHHAAFAAARYGAMNPNDDGGIAAAATNAAPPGVVGAGSVVIVPAAAPRTSGHALKVSLSYTYRPLTPLLSGLIGSSLVLREHHTDVIR